jgi:hypothetical protein
LIYNEGVYEQKLDSLYLSSNKKSIDNFTAIPFEQGSELDSIELTFTSEMGYLSTYNIAIATSSGDEQNLNFLPLFSYQSNPATTYSDNLIKFKIKKEKFLFVAKQNYVTNETEVSKFEISPMLGSGSRYQRIIQWALTILLLYLMKMGNIVISENGANPIEFVLQDKVLPSKKNQKSLDYTSLKNVSIDWNFPSLYNTENYTAPLNQDTVNVKIEVSLKDALKNLEDKRKAICLLIVNEPKDVFDKVYCLAQNSSSDLGYYDETDKNIFDFSFYNLKEDEQSWLEKINYSEKHKFIVLSLNESVIYSTQNNL